MIPPPAIGTIGSQARVWVAYRRYLMALVSLPCLAHGQGELCFCDTCKARWLLSEPKAVREYQARMAL